MELSLGFYQNDPPHRNLFLPLLNFCVAEGGKTREAVLFVVMNHVFRDLFNGRKGSWEVNKGKLGWPPQCYF